jgi:hypothetical protein
MAVEYKPKAHATWVDQKQDGGINRTFTGEDPGVLRLFTFMMMMTTTTIVKKTGSVDVEKEGRRKMLSVRFGSVSCGAEISVSISR